MYKIIVNFYFLSIVVCNGYELNKNGSTNHDITNLSLRTKSTCKTGTCFSKCCPIGMVYHKQKKSKCVRTVDNDFIVEKKQRLHNKSNVTKMVNLTTAFKTLTGMACLKKFVLHVKPFFLQEVSYPILYIQFFKIFLKNR